MRTTRSVASHEERSTAAGGVGRESGHPSWGPVTVFSGGGTGGHLYPALALAGALRERRPDVRTFFVGAERGIESRVLPERGVDHLLVPVEGFRRGGGWSGFAGNVSVAGRLLAAVARVAEVFHALRPGLVVVTGGYAGGPAGLVASLMGVRLVLQEQNSVPGITTRALSLLAREIHLAFPEAADRLPRRARRRARVSGNPVRPPHRVDRTAAAHHFGLDAASPVVLVVGGSQGAQAINRALMEALEERPDSRGFQLLWSTGPSHLPEVRGRLEALGDPEWVRAVGYIEEMPEALGLAALAVSRAGAMATSEFLAWGLPALLIPLPTAAADHQRRNAAALAEAGAALLLHEEGLSGTSLLDTVRELVSDAGRLERLAAAARARGRPEAAREIADALAAHLPPARRDA